MYDFHKNFCENHTYVFLNIYLHPLSKNLILLKKIYPAKKTHSVKHEFYFQFSFATNEQVYMIVKIYEYFFEILLL